MLTTGETHHRPAIHRPGSAGRPAEPTPGLAGPTVLAGRWLTVATAGSGQAGAGSSTWPSGRTARHSHRQYRAELRARRIEAAAGSGW